MIENLETLIALSKAGTMMEASTALRISQSAVSKRIAALERYYDRDLIERHGRRVVLTHHGTRLVERVTPLLSELRSVFLEDNALRKGKIILGVSEEAILASWGSTLFSQVRDLMPSVEFEFHAQRSPVVLDRLRSGEYMVGICTGSPDADTDLVSEVIRQEPMVIIPSGLKPLKYRSGDPLDVMTIESRSGAWGSIEENMQRLNLHRSTSLESFFCRSPDGAFRFWSRASAHRRGDNPGDRRKEAHSPVCSGAVTTSALCRSKIDVRAALGAYFLSRSVGAHRGH